jgi:hypothetical protein
MCKNFFQRIAIAAVLAAASLYPAGAMVVRTAPPLPPHASATVHRPHGGMVWTPGYYRWRGGRYSWAPGRWVYPPRPGAIWVAPTWRHVPGGYMFVAGKWR